MLTCIVVPLDVRTRIVARKYLIKLFTAPVATVPTPVERMPSPVPIVSSEVLATIPLPGESFDNFPPSQNDISPSEPTSETSSVSPSAETEDKENVSEDASKVLKYSFKEDQWSSLNPEEKKQYDRDFLLKLQGEPMSLIKPTNLPNLDIIKDKPHPSVNRHSKLSRGEKPSKIISFASSLTQNITLHESENACKPLNKLSLTGIAQEDLDQEKLKRSVQGVLNKLTPQKFETLLAQLKGLNIDTEEKLNIVLDLIFENHASTFNSEPNFSVSYANLCKHLAMIKEPLADAGGQVNFRKLLLTKFQKEFEFEQGRSNMLKHVERMKALKEDEPDKQKEMKLEFDLEEKKMRYRQLGNIRFIGELFKLGMLMEPSMHECIKKLLKQGDEESLECFCTLLKRIGKELDEAKFGKFRHPSPMDMYFAQMQKIVDKRLTSSRVQFMLQYVIDLRKNSWEPRRDEHIPKTIDQIHQEAKREVCKNKLIEQINRLNDRDRRKASGRNIGTSEDGWTSSSSKSNKGSYSALDPLKLKLTKPDEVESIRLGPGGRGLQSWGRGFSGRTKSTAEEVKIALIKRYLALFDQSLTSSNYDGRRGSQRPAASSLESSCGRSNQLPIVARKTSSTSKEREDLLETVRVYNRSTESKSQDTKKNTDVHVNGKAADLDELCLRGPEYSEEEMEKKTKPLIDEFLHNNDFEGTIKLGEFWKESGLQWTNFLEAKPNAQMTIEEIKKNLLSLLEKKEPNETVFDWIDANVSGNSEPTFIRALVSAVHEDVISGSGATCELTVAQLKERTALLTHYINHNGKLELQALYAIQALMNQLGQPNGLLRQIFDNLYDDNVITEETFKAWESSTDPNESEGKGVAVHSVKSFFTWLRESESGEQAD